MSKQTGIRNNAGTSSYFGGGHRKYGLYQWNIKYYGFESEFEIESAQSWAFGSYGEYDDKWGFYYVNEILGRPISASIEGRSGGWFAVHEQLSDRELALLDTHIANCREQLPDYLEEEREFHREEAERAEKEEKARTVEIENDPRVAEIKRLVSEVAGSDAVLMLKGVKVL